MKVLLILILLISSGATAQSIYFPDDGQQKTAAIPAFDDAPATQKNSTAVVTIDFNDEISLVSKYIYGHNSNIYMTQVVDQGNLVNRLKQLSPNIIRYPGGTLSGAYFFNAEKNERPADAPEKILDGSGNEVALNYWYGRNSESWTMSIDNYYSLLEMTNSTGIITVNYEYARYSTAEDPVGSAAHLAAEWVRYDNGRTRFWEIGNEEYGNWQYGYRIKTSTNHDNQPEIITGELYGKHFKVFADSMRKAASETGATIYIGAMLKEEAPQDWWSDTDRYWNSGIFEQAGDSPDYFIVHSYYTPYAANSSAAEILNSPATVTRNNHDYVQQQMTDAGFGSKPIALTEWNIFAKGSKQQVSFVNGMFGAMVLGEAIKNKYAMAIRWDLANGWSGGNDHGIFSMGDEPGSIPKWNPRPSFYYMYYFQKYFGDRMVNSIVSGDDNILAYASTFTSGQAGIVLVNKGTSEQAVSLDVRNFGVGERYYYHTLTGGDDNGDFSLKVNVNSLPATLSAGGPLNFESIKAKGTTIGDGITITTPARSVTYILIENGTNVITGLRDEATTVHVYPNPARSGFTVTFPPDDFSEILILDSSGRQIVALPIASSQTSIQIQNPLPKGLYFVKLNRPAKSLCVKVTID